MYKLSTSLVVPYFATYLLCMRAISYRIGYEGETEY